MPKVSLAGIQFTVDRIQVIAQLLTRMEDYNLDGVNFRSLGGMLWMMCEEIQKEISEVEKVEASNA